MIFLRLPDPLLSVLYEDDDIIAIDKSYGFNAHTNDSKLEHGDAIEDGLIEIYEKQLGQKLHIIHRLDQTTTGVMIFGKTQDTAKKYKEFFYDREVKKNYLFITKNKSAQQTYVMDQPIIHKGKELEAKTELKFLNSSSGFSLWQANPYTGRNHQIRIHAKVAGLSIYGDSKYEGAANSFLCLHNLQIKFPNGLIIRSEPPAYFNNLDLLTDPLQASIYFEIDRRQRLFQSHTKSSQCFRWVHNKNGSLEPGFTLDQYGSILVLNWYRPTWNKNDEIKFSKLADSLKKSIVVYLMSEKDKQRLVLPIGTEIPKSWLAFENTKQFEIHSETAPTTGLFLNQRLQRQWVMDNAKGKSILNLFSHTGSYGVAALIGGASQVTLVESNKTALEWAKRNCGLNNTSLDKAKFFLRDSITFMEQNQAKSIKYDLIICEAPTFFRREKGIFRVEKDLENLLSLCFQCLNPSGQILLSSQYDGFFIDDLRQLILKVQKNMGLKTITISSILASLDFELPEQKTNLKSFLIKI